MRKVYIDLAIVGICILMIFKHPVLFLLVVGAFAVVWFFMFDDKKRKEIKDKISEFYR